MFNMLPLYECVMSISITTFHCRCHLYLYMLFLTSIPNHTICTCIYYLQTLTTLGTGQQLYDSVWMLEIIYTGTNCMIRYGC
jgi:ABC-type maltose transport system permease subunit